MPKNIVGLPTVPDRTVAPVPNNGSAISTRCTASRTITPDNAIGPSEQAAFYDARLGTDIGATAITAPVRFIQKLLGSVMGSGIKRNIADCPQSLSARRQNIPVRVQPRRLHRPQPREPAYALWHSDEDARRSAHAFSQVGEREGFETTWPKALEQPWI
jgi:hypothetical protein